MQIRRIALERFGRLDGQELELKAGLNLIKGPNEAGKSTLREAILFGLLGNPRLTTIGPGKRVDDRVTWGAGRRFRLELDLVDDRGGAHTLHKDWSDRSARLTNCTTGACTEEPDSVQGALGELLGCGSAKLFRSTVCVEQDALEEVSAGRREIGDQLQAIVTGGADEATVSTVLRQLDEKIAQMERGITTSAPINPGPIKRARDEIGKIDERLSDVRLQVERAGTSARRLIELGQEISESQAALEASRALVILCDRRHDLAKQRDDAEREEAQLDRLVELAEGALREIELATQELAGYEALSQVNEASDRELARLHEREEDLAARAEERSAELTRLRARRTAGAQPGRGPAPRLIVAAVLGLAAFGAGLALGATSTWVVGIPLALVGLAVLGTALARLLAPRLESQMADEASLIPFQEAELVSDREELQSTTATLDAKLAALGCSTYEELVDRLGRRRALEGQRNAAIVQRDTLLGDRSLQNLVEARRAQSRLRRDAEEALAEPGMRRASTVDALAYEGLVRGIGEQEQKLHALQTEVIACETRTSDAQYSIDDIFRLEEQRAGLETRLGYLEGRLAVCRTARDAIQQAKEQTMRSARDELNPRISAYLRRLTNGRYDRVQADEELDLQVFSPEKDGWVKPSAHELSRGTIDQLYLAARLALLDLIYGAAKVPLLLDDPFVKFDAERRNRAVALCQEIARDHQVLLFTCHDGYDAAANWIVELPAP